ncbi:hypothetical protein MUP01_02500 [Candidatus Bathyarchaeota archaeon]|nr:hypothetical protein [Candidatus Bathyarchaeota archaeon]
MGIDPTEFSPYAGVYNCTAIDLSIHMVSTPKALIGGTTIDVLGKDAISGNVAIRCRALADPTLYQYFSSPTDQAYRDVEYPFIGDPNDNNIIVDANHFLPDGITPKRDSPMNLGGGRYRGAIEPYHELRGNLDFDEFVNLIDFAIAASRYNGNLNEIKAVADDWLKEEPNDPNGNPKISKATLPALGRCFVDARVRTRGGSDVNPEISGGPGRGSLWWSERRWVEHGGELCLRRVDFYCS